MKIIGSLVVIALIGVGAYFFTRGSNDKAPTTTVPDTATDTKEPTATTTLPVKAKGPTSVIGASVEKRDITAYHFGTGDTEILFVGGTHGGYSWNTALVAYELIDHLKARPDVIPKNVQVTVIPVLNPDGLVKVAGTADHFAKKDVSASSATRTSGRFNAKNVDLNRNFDCAWQATGTWQNKPVSGGATAFSEPETVALKSYVETNKPAGVVVWYSAAGGVFASKCLEGILPETHTLTNTYAQASGYKAYEDFDFYEVTGDMVNWLAKEKIPAISVLLSTHEDTEWTKNKAGIEAVLKHFAQ
ncbi:MAG: M14 family metallopeptidase [Patescibacteria group bacterium]